jgi:type IV secretion system protein TrbI
VRLWEVELQKLADETGLIINVRHYPPGKSNGTRSASLVLPYHAELAPQRSDLPGQVTGRVAENVYDSPTDQYLIIPQGSKSIGVYDSQVATGQERLLLVWNRLMLQNGRSIVLERQSGADPPGGTGLEDSVGQR